MPSLKTQQLQVIGMDCTSCKMKIEGALERLKGVDEASVTVATGRLVVSYDPERLTQEDIEARVKSLGYTIGVAKSEAAQTRSKSHSHDHSSHDHSSHDHSSHDHSSHDHSSHDHSSHDHSSHSPNKNHADGDSTEDGHSHGSGEFNLKSELPPVVLSVVLLIVAMVFEKPLHDTLYSLAEFAVIIPAYLMSGWTVLKTAGRNILRGQVFDENFLMTIATLGALAIHQLPEAVTVMLFFRFGELFQEYSVGQSRRSIQSLLEIRPDSANLQVDGIVKVVAPNTVQVGDRILVKPGEKVPLDGEIIEGNAQLDTSALTGESVPRIVKVGDTVLAGMINKSGVLTLRVTKLFGESSIAKILDLVENASSKKAATEKFITKFARIYTPIVVILSLLVAIVPPLLIADANRSEWVYRALILLVISCPCGLVISIPLGYFGGIGGAAKNGILIKGSAFLDTLTAIKTVVFDKTGTLTKGTFSVTKIVPNNSFTELDILMYAAHAEVHSNHPIAQSIRDSYGKVIDSSLVSDYEEIAGHGIRAAFQNKVILAGNDRLLHRENIDHDTCDVVGTIVHLAVNGQYAGYLSIADEIKEDAVQAIQNLKRLGVDRVVMLTGDNDMTAKQVANQLGLDDYLANLLPEDKVSAIEKILVRSGKEKVVFVGDGINDAPVIARADVGIAMGAMGSDAAIETADVVLMTDAPSKVAEAIQIAQKTRRIVIQNIVLAMVIKGIFIGLGTIGLATLWEAVFADVGVALLAILNAGRVMK